MKLRLGILALMVALAACGSSAASSQTAPSKPAAARHCGPAGATTLASGAQARVYSWHGGVFGCAFGRGHSFRLGGSARSIRENSVTLVAVAGTDAAYSLEDFGVDTTRTNVMVRHLTDGATLSDFPATAHNVVEGLQSVRSVAVKSDGAVAWIGSTHSIVGRRSLIEVHAANASSSTDRILDSGAGIDPTSLRLHGSTLSWKDGATTRRATLR
jgi:hypothetical protein